MSGNEIPLARRSRRGATTAPLREGTRWKDPNPISSRAGDACNADRGKTSGKQSAAGDCFVWLVPTRPAVAENEGPVCLRQAQERLPFRSSRRTDRSSPRAGAPSGRPVGIDWRFHGVDFTLEANDPWTIDFKGSRGIPPRSFSRTIRSGAKRPVQERQPQPGKRHTRPGRSREPRPAGSREPGGRPAGSAWCSR